MRKEYAGAHAGMLEIAVRMAGSPLISTDNPMGSEEIRNATGNAQAAMLANARRGPPPGGTSGAAGGPGTAG